MTIGRLFFALRPDGDAGARIHALAQRSRDFYQLRGGLLPVERLHVTLCFLGEYLGLEPEVLRGASTVATNLRGAPFELAFDRLMSFQRKDGDPPLVLCRDDDCAPLTQLRDGLGGELARTGLFKLDKRSFKPHVTLAYDKKMISLQEVAPISWTVTEVLLIHSLDGQGKHEVLGRYPLR